MKQKQVIGTTLATAASLFLPLAVVLQPSNAAETTIGVCMTNNDTIRIYNQNGQLTMRAFDRVRNRAWLDTAASKTTTQSFVEYRNIRGETNVVTSFSRVALNCAVNVGGRSQPGQVTAGNPGNVSQNTNVGNVERTCLNRAQQAGYRIYSQTPPQPAASFYVMNLEGTTSNGNRYSMRCRYTTAYGTATLEDIRPMSGSGTGYPSGYSTQMYYGIPGYERGIRVKNSGYQDVSSRRRNFLVKNDVSNVDFRWYADCTTQDQIYDGQKYLGYNNNARMVLAYACSLGRPNVPIQPR